MILTTSRQALLLARHTLSKCQCSDAEYRPARDGSYNHNPVDNHSKIAGFDLALNLLCHLAYADLNADAKHEEKNHQANEAKKQSC